MKQLPFLVIFLTLSLGTYALQIDSLVTPGGYRCSGKAADLYIYYSGNEWLDTSNVFVVELSDGYGRYHVGDTIGSLKTNSINGFIKIQDFIIKGGDGDFMIKIHASSPDTLIAIKLIEFNRKFEASYYGRIPWTGDLTGPGYCDGDSVLLCVQGNFNSNFSWYRNDIIMPEYDSNSHNLCRLVKSPAYYKVVFTNPCYLDSIEIDLSTSPAKPKLVLNTPTGKICEGTEQYIEASFDSGTTYRWFIDNKAISYTGNRCQVSVAGTYKVEKSSGPGCINSASAYVNLSSGSDVQVTAQAITYAGKVTLRSIQTVNGGAWAMMLDYANSYYTPLVNPVVKTINNGNAWQQVTITGSNGLVPIDLAATSMQTAWVAMWNPANSTFTIFKTSTGGASWSTQCSGCFSGAKSSINGIHFFNDSDGVVYGDVNGTCFEIYTTSNGGTSWTKVLCNNQTLIEPDAYGIPTQSIHAGNSIGFTTWGNHFFLSNDKGAHWKQILLPVTFLGGIVLLDSSSWLFYGIGMDGSGLFRTVDGGKNYKLIDYIGPFKIDGLFKGPNGMIFSSSTSIVSGERGISYSRDGGKTWHLISDASVAPAYEISFLGNRGYSGTLHDTFTAGGIFMFTCDTLNIFADKDSLTCNDSILLHTSSTTGTYAWTLNGKEIQGAINDSIILKQGGTVQLKKNNGPGCPLLSNEITLFSGRPETPIIIGEHIVNSAAVRTYSAAFKAGNTYHWSVIHGNIIGYDTPNQCIIKWDSANVEGKVQLVVSDLKSCFGDTGYLPVTVSHSPNDKLVLYEDSLQFDWYGNVKDSFFLYSNTSWKATTQGHGWLHITPETATGSAWITYHCDTNKQSARVEWVTFASKGVSASIPVIQSRIDSVNLVSVNKDTIAFSANKLQDSIHIQSLLPWTINQLPGWLHATPSSGSGETTIMFQADHMLMAIRNAEIVVHTAIEDKSLWVIQSDNSGLPREPVSSLVNIFPNPTHDWLNINSQTGSVYTLYIYQYDGKLVYTGMIPEQANKVVDLRSWPRGLYLLRLSSGHEETYRKLVIE